MFSRPTTLCLTLFLVGCRNQIQHGLEERDANEIITELTSRGFGVKKVLEKGKRATWAIELDDSKATEALRVLTDLKLPRKARKTTQSLVETASLIETPQAEKLRALEALEGDIEEALETMDGVKSASVELVVPAGARPGAQPVPSKASVLLRLQPDAHDRIQQQRAELRALVAASVEGLGPNDVVLVLDVVLVQSPFVPLPSGPSESPSDLRALVVVLGVVVSVLAATLMTLFFRLRRKELKSATTSTAPASPRPVIAANVQRKAA
jgi:type III secretion protein J